MKAKYIKFGRFQVMESELKGKSLGEAKALFPNVRESWLVGALSKANAPAEEAKKPAKKANAPAEEAKVSE